MERENCCGFSLRGGFFLWTIETQENPISEDLMLKSIIFGKSAEIRNPLTFMKNSEVFFSILEMGETRECQDLEEKVYNFMNSIKDGFII
jgi:hypothetical protein